VRQLIVGPIRKHVFFFFLKKKLEFWVFFGVETGLNVGCRVLGEKKISILFHFQTNLHSFSRTIFLKFSLLN
jgi:hypothetical protein